MLLPAAYDFGFRKLRWKAYSHFSWLNTHLLVLRIQEAPSPWSYQCQSPRPLNYPGFSNPPRAAVRFSGMAHPLFSGKHMEFQDSFDLVSIAFLVALAFG